jgi:16S rRNA A1518/A1519 N6-dimethyltransferase RsmA/KsgA/DIM1 with predicted DNA glycosylase/AP lyase activity
MQRAHTRSQNFLRSPAFAKELIGHTNIKKTDTVFDIGAGSGVVSSALAKKVAQVVAIEVDERLIPTLHKNLDGFDNVQIVHADALTFAFPLDEPYKIFANIPFNLSSPLVRRFCELPFPPQAVYIIVQEQFARRLMPDIHGRVGEVGTLAGEVFTLRIRRRLRPEDFYPRPHVPTVLLEMLKR